MNHHTTPSKLDEILTDLVAQVIDDTVEDLPFSLTKKHQSKATTQIKELLLSVIGEDNEHRKDMPVPDPDPFLLPQDHQNQLRRYLRKKVEEL